MNGPVSCIPSTLQQQTKGRELDITLMDKRNSAQGHVRVHTDGFTPFTGPKGDTHLVVVTNNTTHNKTRTRGRRDNPTYIFFFFSRLD